MEIRTVSLADMNPAAYNPRKQLTPEDKEWEKLNNSIETFGYVEPIIWNENTGNIVGGHQRYSILQAKGYASADCVVVHLDDREEKQLNLSLNKITGRWDIPMLTDLLTELDAVGQMGPTGFEAWELESLQVQYDHINDLMEETFSDFSPEKEKQTFTVTFSLPLSEEESVRNYIAAGDGAKAKLSTAVINHVKGLD